MSVKQTTKKPAAPVLKTITEDEIRLRSYLIWEREGRPNGRDKIHWQMALAELIAEQESAFQPQKQSAPRPRKAAGRKVSSKSGRSSNGSVVL